MSTIFRGIIVAAFAAPIVYLLFNGQEPNTRISSTVILSVALGVLSSVFFGSSKSGE